MLSLRRAPLTAIIPEMQVQSQFLLMDMNKSRQRLSLCKRYIDRKAVIFDAILALLLLFIAAPPRTLSDIDIMQCF